MGTISKSEQVQSPEYGSKKFKTSAHHLNQKCENSKRENIIFFGVNPNPLSNCSDWKVAKEKRNATTFTISTVNSNSSHNNNNSITTTMSATEDKAAAKAMNEEHDDSSLKLKDPDSDDYDDYDDFAEDDGFDSIQNHYDTPLADLKKSFLQFSSGMKEDNKDKKKKKKKKEKKHKKSKRSTDEGESPSGKSSKAPRMSTRDELTQSLQEFQAAMNAKSQTKPMHATMHAKSQTKRAQIDDSERSMAKSLISEAETANSVATEELLLDQSLSQFLPTTFRQDSTTDKGLDNNLLNLVPPFIVSGGDEKKSPTDQQRQSSCPPNEHIDDEASEEGLAPLEEDEASEEGLAPLQEGDVSDEDEDQDARNNEAKTNPSRSPSPPPKEDSLRDSGAAIDDQSEDGSTYEEPLPETPSSRKDTLGDLKKFHQVLSNRDLSFTVHNDEAFAQHPLESTSSSDGDESAASVDPPKMSSTQSLERRDGLGTPKIVLSKKDRASELKRQNVEMSQDDLLSSLKAFQTQIEQKLNKGGTATTAVAVRTRQKAPSRGRPSRHKSVEVEVAPPPARKSLRRGSMMEMPKSESKRRLQSSRSVDGWDEEANKKLSTKEIEDRNFRKWFESKMDARVDDSERFILEEDDHAEGPVEDKSHAPLVVNVLNSEASPPSARSSSQADKHEPIPSKEKTNPKVWTSVDRAFQIKKENTLMTRDEIKASLLQFQSQMKTKAAGAAQRKTEKAAVSSEFRLAVPQQTKGRLAQIEKQNDSLSRDQLTASLLAFQSNLKKKVPSANDDGAASKETRLKPVAEGRPLLKAVDEEKPLDKPLTDSKVHDEIGNKNNLRRAKGREERIKMLEEEQAAIPRNVMLASLQKFQADIQGRMDTSQSTQISLDSPHSSKVRKTSKLEHYDAKSDDTSMEVTEHEYHKVLERSIHSSDAPELKEDSSDSEEPLEASTTEGSKTEEGASRQEMMKNLLSFQSEIQGKIEKKKSANGSESSSQAGSVSVDKTTKEQQSPHPSPHPPKFESMLKNLEDLKKRNEKKVSTMQNLDRARKRNEEKVSAVISALSPEDATEMPPWFAEFAQQQENKFQELVQISEQRNKEIMRLSNDTARSQVRSLSNHIDENTGDFSQTNSLKPHEKEQRTTPASSAHNHPGQFMGYPESQASVTETSDFSATCEEATYFIQRFSQETGLLHGKRLEERLEEVKSSIAETGSYTQSYDELQYGCRLAWRNCGQFIMRSSYSTLTVRDCREAKTADDCFKQCVKHLKDIFDGGFESPVISVFQPREDGKLAPVRIWNRELLGYAAYKRDDGSIMGDSSNLDLTALCVQFGWIPPKEKSDFDILPLLISDESRGHDDPQVFAIPPEAIHEVELDHPDFDLFNKLNLRWYVQASDASMGIDIGGVLYQTAPFTRLYQATEISSCLLDQSRYGFAEAIAAACALRKTHLSLWRDDVQLQTQKSILNSFLTNGLRCLDPHAVSEEFVDFYSSQVQEYGSCPADWTKVVAPATSSMTVAYHQEMTNFLVKPQYLDQRPCWDDLDLLMPQPITIKSTQRSNNVVFHKGNCQYDHIFVYYASETGTSLRLATLLVGDFDGSATGPIPLDSLPDLLLESVEKRSLAIVVTATASSGTPPLHAKHFLGEMRQVPKGSLHNIDFAICSVCNSAYTESLASFAYIVEANLKRAGCVPTMGIHYVDTLEGTGVAFADFRKKLFEEAEGILYKQNPAVEPTEPKGVELATMTFENLVPVLKLDSIDGESAIGGGNYLNSWERNSNKLNRSLDLFRFKLNEEDENQLNGLASGDHVALYPHNMNDVVETVLRHVNAPDAKAAKEYLKEYKDLSKALSFDELSFLDDYIQGNDIAVRVLDELLTNLSSNSPLSVEKLVQIMPPVSIPMNWILKYVPSMDPRFYSIASIDGRKKTVSLVQSVYTFDGSGKAGVASRWLRSMTKGQKVNATFTTTNFRLPHDDEGAPVVLISSGPGIAPCRTFWLSGRRNPTYLFCGCNSPEELPYSTEIELLKKKGLLHPFIAYSHSSGSKMELEGLLRKERATLLDLLHNSRTRLYVCGSPEVDAKVRNSLAMILAQGHSRHRGMGMSKAMERLALMSQSKLYVREVYGNPIGDATRADPMYALWQESTVKVVRALAALEKLEIPVAPFPPRQNSRKLKKGNEESHTYNPMISGS